jgi:hypothetical protein
MILPRQLSRLPHFAVNRDPGFHQAVVILLEDLEGPPEDLAVEVPRCLRIARGDLGPRDRCRHLRATDEDQPRPNPIGCRRCGPGPDSTEHTKRHVFDR